MQGKLKLTQEKYDMIPALLAQGLKKAQIAERFGVTPATLSVQCSRRGVSLRKGGPLAPRRKVILPEAPLDLNVKTLIALRVKARALGTDEASLIKELLETIVADDLYTAVLDLEPA